MTEESLLSKGNLPSSINLNAEADKQGKNKKKRNKKNKSSTSNDPNFQGDLNPSKRKSRKPRVSNDHNAQDGGNDAHNIQESQDNRGGNSGRGGRGGRGGKGGRGERGGGGRGRGGRGWGKKMKYQFRKKDSRNEKQAMKMDELPQESLLLTNEELKAPILEETGGVDGKNHTLYIKNLNPKIKVWNIVAYRTPLNMRGQAFVVLDSILNATKALHELNGVTFIDRSLHLEFSKNKSLVVAEIEGTYNEVRQQQLSKKKTGTKRKYRGELEEELLRLKRRRIETPSNYLLIDNLPEQVGSTEGRDKFIMLLRDRDGYRDVNVKGYDLAIVQFSNKDYARNAKLALDGYTFLDKQLNVSFYDKGKGTSS